MSSGDDFEVTECSGWHFLTPTSIWIDLAKNFFFIFFQNFLTHFKLFLAYKWGKTEGKILKMPIFQKWSPKSKIRNGYDLRLYVNSLRRLWWPLKCEIGCAPAPFHWAHEITVFKNLHSSSSLKSDLWVQNSIFEKLFKIA